MAVNVEFVGTKEVAAALRKGDAAISAAVASSMVRAGFVLEAEVKNSIAGRGPEPRSVKTGLFLRSVTSRSSATEAEVSSNVVYSDHLEYGTSKMKARKHFRNSLARKKSSIEADLRTSVKDATKNI